MSIELREMAPSDYDAILDLWRTIPGFTPRPVADSRDAITRLLERNPGLSVVAVDEGRIAGCALATHDGRRGCLQHVVVAETLRGRGVATAMVDICLRRLKALHLDWVHLDVTNGNDAAMAFWQRAGWSPREELTRLSRPL
jgi:N-acetylglutamate synthase